MKNNFWVNAQTTLVLIYCGFKRNKGKLGKLRRDWEELVRVANGGLLAPSLHSPSLPHPLPLVFLFVLPQFLFFFFFSFPDV